jgi:ATP-dependent Lhr-like helicase
VVGGRQQAQIVDHSQRVDEHSLRLRRDLTPGIWKTALSGLDKRLCLPTIDEDALTGLKFNTALPWRLAEATLSARLADLDGAQRSLREPVRFSRLS